MNDVGDVLPDDSRFDPVELVSAPYRFALWNAVCVLAASQILPDDKLVSSAKKLLTMVDDDIRQSYWKEHDVPTKEVSDE